MTTPPPLPRKSQGIGIMGWIGIAVLVAAVGGGLALSYSTSIPAQPAGQRVTYVVTGTAKEVDLIWRDAAGMHDVKQQRVPWSLDAWMAVGSIATVNASPRGEGSVQVQVYVNAEKRAEEESRDEDVPAIAWAVVR